MSVPVLPIFLADFPPYLFSQAGESKSCACPYLFLIFAIRPLLE